MKRSRKGIELKTKYLCLKELENGQKRKVLAEKHGIRENSISDWVKKRMKSIRGPSRGNVRNCLMDFHEVSDYVFNRNGISHSSYYPLH